jgi:hypothetical protein
MMKRKPCKKVMLACLVIFFVLGGFAVFFSSITFAQDKKEIGRNDVQGKVLSTRINAMGRGVIEVKSDLTDNVYIFYVGIHTVYNSTRPPAVGETIKVTYYNDEEKLRAVRVLIIKIIN